MIFNDRERLYLEMLEVAAHKYESILQAVNLEDAKRHAVDGIKSIDGLFKMVNHEKRVVA